MRLVGLIGSTVVGWAAPVAGAGAGATVELFIDGNPIEAAEANRPPPADREMAQLALLTPAPSAMSTASDWFALKTPQELRTGKELRLEVRRGGELVGQGQCRLFGGLKGKLVGVHEGVIQGFVSNPFGDEAPPPLELRLDGQSLGQIATEPPAADGRRRFNLKLPPDLRDGEMHDIEIFWAGSDAALPGSPHRWQAPKPRDHAVIKAREIDRALRKSRPAYVLPAAELAAVSTMLRGQTLRRGAPAAVAENAETIWRTLAQSQPAGGPRVCIVLTASTFSDVESSFALGQLLTLYPGATVRVMLPSKEAVRFAADDQRNSARDGLALTFANIAFAAFASRLPADDLLVFVPAHAVLSKAFLNQTRAVVDKASDGVVAVCAQAMATPYSLLLATPAPAAWTSSRDCVAVLRAADLSARVRSRRFAFEGVRFDDIELQVDGSKTAGAVVQVASPPQMPAARALIVMGRQSPDAATLARFEALAEIRTLAGAAVKRAPKGWTLVDLPDEVGKDKLKLAAGLAGADGDVILLEASVASDIVSDLPAFRALAAGHSAYAIRRLGRAPQLTGVALFEEAVDAALAAKPAGFYIPAP